MLSENYQIQLEMSIHPVAHIQTGYLYFHFTPVESKNSSVKQTSFKYTQQWKYISLNK